MTPPDLYDFWVSYHEITSRR
ncbi:hypothetical protein AERO9AM_20211 [Aeromicrobium sp. 9AM]|nr:hypothetical protein AERO9AM_20211 [Aeromicrobium sp. 9AM]